jgi:hypothetical protein
MKDTMSVRILSLDGNENLYGQRTDEEWIRTEKTLRMDQNQKEGMDQNQKEEPEGKFHLSLHSLS